MKVDLFSIAALASFASYTVAFSIDSAHDPPLQSITERAEIMPECDGRQREIVVEALKNCQNMAKAASKASYRDLDRVEKYFGTRVGRDTNVIRRVFDKVAEECGKTRSGRSRIYCINLERACIPGITAAGVDENRKMVLCPLFFDNFFPLMTDDCVSVSKANTLIHEMTHIQSIGGTLDYPPANKDVRGTSYDIMMSLSPEQRINHADTYALFAQSVYAAEKDPGKCT